MSASTQVIVPTFDGGDSVDAEDFIHAIRAKAFSEGKDDDQKWILKLVTASLTRDALRWHADLDPSIRQDWWLLQKALLARFCPTFKGIDGEECERFILSLRRRAFEQGKAGDNEWITQFVASCVAEDAFRWHLDLAPEIQNDWALLQKAMAARYPPPEVRKRRIKSPTIPTPASAAPAPPITKTGRIRVIDPTNPSAKTYISTTLYSSKYFVTCQNSAQALVVEYNPSSHTLRIQNLSGAFDLLGLCWNDTAPEFSATSYSNARLAAMSGPPSTPTTCSYSNSGTRANVWDISSDGSIKINWTDENGGLTELFPRTHVLEVVVVGEKGRYYPSSSGWAAKNFVFEAA